MTISQKDGEGSKKNNISKSQGGVDNNEQERELIGNDDQPRDAENIRCGLRKIQWAINGEEEESETGLGEGQGGRKKGWMGERRTQ